MKNIKSAWILLSNKAALCCNESPKPSRQKSIFMPFDLFDQIAKWSKEQSKKLIILSDKKPIPEEYITISNDIAAEIIVPVDYKGEIGKIPYLSVSIESNQSSLAVKYNDVAKAILRLHKSDLPRLSEIILQLSNCFSQIHIRHPELLSYNEQDLLIYKQQLLKIGRHLLNNKNLRDSFQIDCLTNPMKMAANGECLAGVEKIAIGPSGKFYLCPAAAKENKYSFGKIFDNFVVPNRHLLTKHYSLPCGKCHARHCQRCLYLNKKATLEFCVPAKNVCCLANYELEAQAWLAQQALKLGLLDKKCLSPAPQIYDPYELVTTQILPMDDYWRTLAKFTGKAGSLKPSMMLDIIHGLQGWFEALLTCAREGSTPSEELLKVDALSSLRRRTIEKYRDMIFEKHCPTVHQLEILMCKAVEQATYEF